MSNVLTGTFWYFWLPPRVIDSYVLKGNVLSVPCPCRSSACDQDTGQLCDISCRLLIFVHGLLFPYHGLLQQWSWTYSLDPIDLGLCDLWLAAIFCSRQYPWTIIWSDDPHFSYSLIRVKFLCLYLLGGFFGIPPPYPIPDLVTLQQICSTSWNSSLASFQEIVFEDIRCYKHYLTTKFLWFPLLFTILPKKPSVQEKWPCYRHICC